MPVFSKESLETLRQRIDIVDVLSSHIEFKKSGASYKALCPFHDEKSPSFMVQKGDHHYHCFGCGAHGDAIAFLMTYLKMSFSDSVEHLAQRYQVPLEVVEGNTEKKGQSKKHIMEALELAVKFFHFMLLYTEEGHQALHYLFSRGIDINFIQQFHLGLAPKASGMLRKILHAKFISDEIMEEAGLLLPGKDGGWKDFFSDRITFPIRNATGSVIGFSARKYKENTYGGKYVNTAETPVFKKSKVLFGLNYSRRNIAKERKAIIVEGQIDALRLIQAGFAITVAGQGTAFGEGHAKELISLGVQQVFLAFDSDLAGQEAACKVGSLFQKEGIEVKIITLPSGSDPDSYLQQQGAKSFLKLLESGIDYLTFLVDYESKKINIDSPAGKTELVQSIAKKIREWEQPLMVHESLRKLAQLTQVPENLIGLDSINIPNVYIKKSASVGLSSVDPDRILEIDFLRWLVLMSPLLPAFVELARLNISPDALKIPGCRSFYQVFLEKEAHEKTVDLLTLAAQIENIEAQQILNELHEKKINKDRAEYQFSDTIKKILDRNWMQAREEVRLKIASGQCSDDEAMELLKEFDYLKKNPPILKKLPE